MRQMFDLINSSPFVLENLVFNDFNILECIDNISLLYDNKQSEFIKNISIQCNEYSICSNNTNNNMIRYTLIAGNGEIIVNDEIINNVRNIRNMYNIKTTLHNQRYQ